MPQCTTSSVASFPTCTGLAPPDRVDLRCQRMRTLLHSHQTSARQQTQRSKHPPYAGLTAHVLCLSPCLARMRLKLLPTLPRHAGAPRSLADQEYEVALHGRQDQATHDLRSPAHRHSPQSLLPVPCGHLHPGAGPAMLPALRLPDNPEATPRPFAPLLLKCQTSPAARAAILQARPRPRSVRVE